MTRSSILIMQCLTQIIILPPVLAAHWPRTEDWAELEVCMNSDMMSMGTGKMMVELFSTEMLFRVWRYRSWEVGGCKCYMNGPFDLLSSPAEQQDCP